MSGVTSTADVPRAEERAPVVRAGNLFGRTLSVFGGAKSTFLTLGLIGMLPQILTSAALAASGDTHRAVAVLEAEEWADVAVVLAGLAGFLVTQLATAAAVYAVFESLRRRPASVGRSLSHGMRCLLPVLGVTIVQSLFITVVMVAAAIPGVVAMAAGASGFGLLLLFVILVPVGFYLFATVISAVPACVVEGTAVVESIHRSAALVKGSRASVVGAIILLALFGWFIGLLGELIGSVLPGIVGVAVVVAVQIVTLALQTVLSGVVYHDLRVTRNGIGTDELARVFA